MQNYPTTITFGGLEYTVEWWDDLITLSEYPGIRGHGACIPYQRKLLISKSPRCPTSVGESFVHEGVEAINFEYDLGLPHQTIKTLGMAMFQMFKEHGAFIFSDGATAPSTVQ